LEEELGLVLEKKNSLQPLFKIDACESTGDEFVWVYRCLADGPFRLYPEEIERGEWFTVDVVDAWVKQNPEEFTSAFPLIWSRLKGC
jgi:hypothetical protein